MKLALSLVLAAGCFGQGPVPALPTGASAVFAAGAPPPDECNNGASTYNYVGDVAFDPDHGYALALGYTPQSCGGGGGGPGGNAGSHLPVFQFAKAGGTPSKLGEIPASTVPPRLAVGGRALWAYQVPGSPATVATPTSTIYQATMGGGPAALLADDAAAYLVVTQNTMNGNGAVDLDHPNYPCCGLVNNGLGMSPLIKLALPGGAATTLPVTPACERSMKSCLAQNATSLFYPVTPTTGHTAEIRSFPKTGTAASDEKTLGAVDGDVVVTGLAADAHTVVWSVGPVVGNLPAPPASCAIAAFDLDTGTMKLLASTSAFSCQDVALAGGAVYFTIVTFGDGTNFDQTMRGLGIGRVSLSAPAFESMAVSVAGLSAGPRRIYVTDAGEVYAVDPFTIAKLDPHALDGRSDFALQ